MKLWDILKCKLGFHNTIKFKSKTLNTHWSWEEPILRKYCKHCKQEWFLHETFEDEFGPYIFKWYRSGYSEYLSNESHKIHEILENYR